MTRLPDGTTRTYNDSGSPRLLRNAERMGYDVRVGVDNMGRDRIKVFDPVSGRFGVYDGSGQTISYYIPKNPAAYWERQSQWGTKPRE